MTIVVLIIVVLACNVYLCTILFDLWVPQFARSAIDIVIWHN